MPKIKQMQDKYADESLIREIRTRQGAVDLMNNRALADACGIPYQTLLRRLQRPEDLTLGESRKLVSTIKPAPEVMLKVLGYSSKDIRNLKGEFDDP